MSNICRITIEDISDKGEGIGRIDGKVCFVSGAIPGDEIDVVITEDKGRFFKAKPVNYDEHVCGGAPLLRMPYEKQLQWKENHVRSCLSRLAVITDPKVNSIIGMEHPYHYRNKGEFKINQSLPFCNINCTNCSIQSEKAMQLVAKFRNEPRKNSEELIVRTSQSGETISYTIQNNGYELLYDGNRIMRDHIGHIEIEVDPFSFYQVNSLQCEKLYSLVKSYIDDDSFLLDLYCGAGTIGLFCSDKCRKVIGVEVVHDAIIQANRNAVINGIVNTTFIEGKAEDVVNEKLQGVKADIIVVDPPRAGCKRSLLETIAKIAPKKLVYVSCDPATLSRDIKILSEMGFAFVEATPVDMFPHTVHVESVVLITRKDK